ncbi:dipeptidase [Halegenticoccus soli]|uniref:dipeptidase n=1 Tax=Halegenticoccus soli TaxID=1985678 RepID=UPI000C6D11A4|nr:dipeptidase [Halegenticoccus soli]
MTRTPPRFFDGHNDTLLRLYAADAEERLFFEGCDGGHLDLPRARRGGFAGGFFAAFVPSRVETRRTDTADGYEVETPPPLRPAYARLATRELLRLLSRVESNSDGAVRVVRTAAELEDCLDRGVLAAVAHLEGAEAVSRDLSNLEALYDAGVRSIGPVWSRENAFGHGVPFRYPSSPDIGPGLTDAGRRLVRACNRLGVVIDLAHLNERGFRDVAALSDAPLAVTHTAAHEICPSSRNLTDEQLDAVGDSGGVVGLTFGVRDLCPDGSSDPELPLSGLVDHVDYVVDRIGIDHAAFGSDFDGATVPSALGDATGLPGLAAALRDRGYGDRDVRKLASENWVRLLSDTWAA